MQKLYSVEEAAQFLGVATRTILRCLNDGRLDGFKVGGKGGWRISEESLTKFCEDSKTMPQREYKRRSPIVLRNRLHELIDTTCPFELDSPLSAKWVYRFFSRFHTLWREEALKQNIAFAEMQKESPRYIQAGFTALEQVQAETDEERQTKLLEQLEKDKPFQVALEQWAKENPYATGEDAMRYEAEYRKTKYEQERVHRHGHDAKRKSKA